VKSGMEIDHKHNYCTGCFLTVLPFACVPEKLPLSAQKNESSVTVIIPHILNLHMHFIK
jgi:hypothetical protein